MALVGNKNADRVSNRGLAFVTVEIVSTLSPKNSCEKKNEASTLEKLPVTSTGAQSQNYLQQFSQRNTPDIHG